MCKKKCQICTLSQFKYLCPKCNILYCSVDCYKSVKHQQCSEEFYKKCVQDEINSRRDAPNDDIHEMHQILRNFQDTETVPDESSRELDSDDDEEVSDIAERLQGVNINDSDKVWSILTHDEKAEFKSMLDNGEISKLMPSFQPWWSRKTQKNLIEDISGNQNKIKPSNCHPQILVSIQPFENICSKTPSPCLWFNICNILGAYTSTVQFFQGDHQSSPIDATNYLLSLSANLKKHVNFDSDEQALKSIISEGLACNLGLYVDDYETIYDSVKDILNGSVDEENLKDYKLAALSDIHKLFLKTKILKFSTKIDVNKINEFHSKFPDIQAENVEELTKSNLNRLIKKMEFLLSFANRDN